MRRWASAASIAALAVVALSAQGAAAPPTCPPPGVTVDGVYFREVVVPRVVARGAPAGTAEGVGYECFETWPPPPGAVLEQPTIPLATIRGVDRSLARRHRTKARVVFVRRGTCSRARPAQLVACLRRAS